MQQNEKDISDPFKDFLVSSIKDNPLILNPIKKQLKALEGKKSNQTSNQLSNDVQCSE